MAFLDNNGVTTLVTRLKTYFALKTEIPTVPTAYKLQPQMDGIASAGTVTSYALGDHIHPHDMSKQDKLVSGTNIKTIDGESILGSGDITVGGGGAEALTDPEIDEAVDDAFVYNITLNAGASITSVQNLQGQTVTTGIVGETYMVVCEGTIASISSTPQVTFQLDSTRKTAYFVMPDEAISIDVDITHQGGNN